MDLRTLADLVTPMCVRVAATLRLHEHTGTATALAEATGTDAAVLRDVLDQLVVAGLFTLEDGRYRATELGARLGTEGRALDIDSWLGRAELAYVDLLHSVRTGEAAYPARYGRDFWSDLDGERRRGFDAQMTERLAVQATQIAHRYDWTRFTDIVDVGGGDGTLVLAILAVHPALRARVLDLPPTAAAASTKLAGRAQAVAGSFFDPLPTGADAYVLSDILHNWDDEHAAKILEGCAEAAGKGGTVLVIEALRAPKPGVATQFDLSMAVFFGGRERTVDELAALAPNMTVREVRQVADNRNLVELTIPN